MDENSTAKERLLTFIRTQGIAVRAFEASCGLANGYVNSIRQSISPKKLGQITTKFPDLNPSWLLTGEGTMLRSSTPPQNITGANIINGNNNSHNTQSNSPELAQALNAIAQAQAIAQETQAQMAKLIAIIERLTGA